MGKTISELVVDLDSESIEQRIDAARSLATLGVEAAPAIIPLLQSLDRTDDEQLNEWMTACLESCGAPATEDLPKLVELLKDSSKDDSRYWALTLIGRMESEGKPACSDVCQLLETYAEQQSGADSIIQRGLWTLGRIADDNEPITATLSSVEQAFPGMSVHVERTRSKIES